MGGILRVRIGREGSRPMESPSRGVVGEGGDLELGDNGGVEALEEQDPASSSSKESFEFEGVLGCVRLALGRDFDGRDHCAASETPHPFSHYAKVWSVCAVSENSVATNLLECDQILLISMIEHFLLFRVSRLSVCVEVIAVRPLPVYLALG